MLADQRKYGSSAPRGVGHIKRILIFDMAVGFAVVGIFVMLKFQKCVSSYTCTCETAQDHFREIPLPTPAAALHAAEPQKADVLNGHTLSTCCQSNSVHPSAGSTTTASPWTGPSQWRSCLSSQLNLANLFLLLHVFVAATWPGLCCQLPSSALTLLRFALIGGRIALVGRHVLEVVFGLRYLWDGISVCSSALLFPVSVPLHAPLALLQWFLLLQPLVNDTLVATPSVALRMMGLNFFSGVLMPTAIMVLLDKYRTCREGLDSPPTTSEKPVMKTKAEQVTNDDDAACCSSHLAPISKQAEMPSYVQPEEMPVRPSVHRRNPPAPEPVHNTAEVTERKVVAGVQGGNAATAYEKPSGVAEQLVENRLAELCKLCKGRVSLPPPQMVSTQKRSSLYVSVTKTSMISVKVSGPTVKFDQHALLLLQAVRDSSSALLQPASAANIGCCAVPGCVQLLLPMVEYIPVNGIHPINPCVDRLDLTAHKAARQQMLTILQDAVESVIPGPPPSISIWWDEAPKPSGTTSIDSKQLHPLINHAVGTPASSGLLCMAPFCLAVEQEQEVCLWVLKDALVRDGHAESCAVVRVVVGGADGSVAVDAEVAVEDAQAQTCYIRFTVPAQQQCGTGLQLLVLPIASHCSAQVYISTPLLVLSTAAQHELDAVFLAAQTEIIASQASGELVPDTESLPTPCGPHASPSLQHAAWSGALQPLLSDMYAVLQLCHSAPADNNSPAPILADLLESVMEYLWQQGMHECLACIMEAAAVMPSPISGVTTPPDAVELSSSAELAGGPVLRHRGTSRTSSYDCDAIASSGIDVHATAEAGTSSSTLRTDTSDIKALGSELNGVQVAASSSHAASPRMLTVPGRFVHGALGRLHQACRAFQARLEKWQGVTFVGMTEGRRWRAAVLCSFLGFSPGLEEGYELYRLSRSQALDACCVVFYSAVLALTCAKAARSGNRLTVTYLVSMVLPHFFLLLLPHLVSRRRRSSIRADGSLEHFSTGGYSQAPAHWLDEKLEQALQAAQVRRGTLLTLLRIILHYFVYRMHSTAGIVSLYILSLSAVTAWDVILRYSFLVLHAEGRAKRCS